MKFKNQNVYLLRYRPYNMLMVYDGQEVVQLGNTGDFYPGCQGLREYKGLTLGNWFGARSLAQIISKGLGKKLVEKNLSAKEYDQVCGVH